MVPEEKVVEEVSLVEAEALGGGEALQVLAGGGGGGVGGVCRWREGVSEVSDAHPLQSLPPFLL